MPTLIRAGDIRLSVRLVRVASLTQEPFVVNLDDPDDVRAKLAEARDAFRTTTAKLVALREVEAEQQKWSKRVTLLEKLAPEGDTRERDATERVTERANGSASVVDLAVGVVNRELRAIRANEVTRTLQGEGHNVTPVAVRNALYYAAHRANKIKSPPGRGLYAPLAYENPAQPLGSDSEGA